MLFTQDADAPKSNRVMYIGTDNVAAGRQAGELMKKALPNGGKAMLFVAQHRDQFLYVDAPTVKRMMEGGTTEALANFRGPGAP